MSLKTTSLDTAATALDVLLPYRLIHDIYVLLDAGDRDAVGVFGLTPTQYTLLTLLDPDGGQRLTALSRRMLLAKSTITRLIDQLEEAGLVQRIVDPADRRAQHVRLTASGAERLARARAAHFDSLQRRMSALSDDEKHALFALLCKLRDALNADLYAQHLDQETDEAAFQRDPHNDS